MNNITTTIWLTAAAITIGLVALITVVGMMLSTPSDVEPEFSISIDNHYPREPDKNSIIDISIAGDSKGGYRSDGTGYGMYKGTRLVFEQGVFKVELLRMEDLPTVKDHTTPLFIGPTFNQSDLSLLNNNLKLGGVSEMRIDTKGRITVGGSATEKEIEAARVLNEFTTKLRNKGDAKCSRN